jgi:tetratricopeptide (TPR) repeat protein
MILLEKGELDAAAECFDAVIKEQPLNSDAWYYMGETNEKLGKFDEAMKCYDEAIKVKDLKEATPLPISKPETPTLIEKEEEEIQPIEVVEDSKPPTSDEIIENLLNGVKKDVEYVKNGRRFERIGNLEEAIKFYDAAIKENPKNVDAWFNKGKVFEKLGYVELAQECIDKVYELTRDD